MIQDTYNSLQNNYHAGQGFDAETEAQLNDMWLRWSNAEGHADGLDYLNDTANGRALQARIDYEAALSHARECRKASHLAACMLEQAGPTLRMARWNVAAVEAVQ